MNGKDAALAMGNKVFVVDDDPIVLQVVREWLQAAGFVVKTREQALGTASWVAAGQPEYLILDVNMTGLSGGELARLMHRSHTTAHIPIVLYSGAELEALAALARTTGALGAIQKTSNARLFMAQFERLVAQHRATNFRRQSR